jgi:hypothetical protein
MGVANTKSTFVTNCDAAPVLPTAAYISHARLREQAAKLEVAAADDATSVYRLFRVRSDWRISEVLLASDAITGLDDVNVGVYDTAANGGAVVNENLFADDLDLSSGLTWTDVTYETTATNIDKVEKQLWELLGLSADPQKEYDICVTAIADPAGAGTIAGLLRYSDNT